MKFQPEDPRLTAYVLGELSAAEAAEIEQAAAADPAVRMALEETVLVQRQLKDVLRTQGAALLPEQRANLLEEFSRAEPVSPVPVKLPTRRVMLVTAAILGLGVIIVLATRNSEPAKAAAVTPAPAAASSTPAASPAVSAPAVASPAAAPAPAAPSTPIAPKTWPAALGLLPLPGPAVTVPPDATAQTSILATVRERDQALAADPTSFLAHAANDAANPGLDLISLPPVAVREYVSTVDAQQLPLPVLTGRASLEWIGRTVREKRALPPTKAVRLEEILNSFDLRPGGTSAIAKGTSLSAESLACPWKPSATLLMIHFQGAIDGPRAVEALLAIDPMAVSKYRLLGFSPIKGAEAATLPNHLPAKTGTTLLVELEPRASAKALGEIRWKVEGADATALPILRVPDAEPSNDARFAALLAAYSLWLTRDQPAIIDDVLVAGLARECAASDMPNDRKDAMILIAKSLEIDP